MRRETAGISFSGFGATDAQDIDLQTDLRAATAELSESI
jgi:hypothetical protein